MYCPKCGKENPEDARYCMHCRADLSEYKIEISPKIEVSPKIDVSLDIEKLRDLKIPDKEEAIVEIVKEFNETLRTIGIPASFDPEKSLDLTPFQKEVAKTVEEKVDEALDKFKKPTGDPMTYIMLGVFEGYFENYDKAVDYFMKAIELDLKSIAAWGGMADCYDRMGEHEKALKCFDMVSSIKPPEMDKKEINHNTLLAWAAKGYHYGEIGEYEKALECFDKILEIEPNFPVWDGRGIALGELGRHEEALRSFDKALGINPKRADMWLLKGVVFRTLKKYNDAIECFNSALEIDPKDAGAWKNKGYVLVGLKRFEEAMRCFDKSLEINPEDADAWKAKGGSLYLLSMLKYKEPKQANNWKEKIYEFKELLEKALASFKKAVELNPNDDSAREEIKRIQKKLLGIREALSQLNSWITKRDIEIIAEFLHSHYDELSKEELVDFLKKLPEEAKKAYKNWSLLEWLLNYVIPPLEDYHYSKKGYHPFLNNASLRKLIKEHVDDEDQREELLEALPYMDKDERIALLKNHAKRLLERE